MTLRLRCLPLLLFTGLAAYPAAAQKPTDKVYTEFENVALPELPGVEGTPEHPQAAVQRLLRLPPGTAVAADERVFVRFVVEKDGSVSSLQITQPVSPAADSAVLAAVRRLPRFRPGQRAGQPARVALAVGVWPGGVPAMAVVPLVAEQRSDTLEARTRRRGLIEVAGGETPEFLWRALPVSFSQADRLITYPWHPSDFGPQLFFSAPGHEGPMAEYERLLFILTPLSPVAYDVQTFHIEQDDLTTLEALFFADANHDGQRDLLALTECSLREGPSPNAPLGGRVPHYQTTAFYYRGLDRAGRPRYEPQVLESLDDVASAAEVRRRLAAPQPKPRAAAPRNPNAPTAKEKSGPGPITPRP